jgi:tRNA-dihydrouridine synthase
MEVAPIDHVVMHYRLGTQQYRGETLSQFIDETLHDIPVPMFLNGDIDSIATVEALLTRNPQAAGVMVGRALVADPAMLCPDRSLPENYRRFHDLLYDAYSAELTGGDHQLLGKMQALWERLLPDADRRARKAIHKATSLDRYHQAVSQLFDAL